MHSRPRPVVCSRVRPSDVRHRAALAFLGCLLVILLAAAPALGDEAAPTGRRVLGADRGRVAIVDASGRVEWEYPCRGTPHDLTLLPNGNVLFINGDREVLEVTPEKQVVWRHAGRPAASNTGRVEIHAAQRLENGNTLIAESGNRRIIEVDSQGNIAVEIPLQVDNPDPHRDTRLVRKLKSGNYLVCHEGDGKVREYDARGQVVWSWTLDLAGRPESPGHGPEGHGTSLYSALELPSGNILIGGGNNNRVVEVNRAGEIVWSVDQRELPGIALAWVTMVAALPNGNVIIGNCHAGPENPQLIEVTRDKAVVWTFRDFETFGDSLAATHVLDEPDQTR
ncbi:MAG: PQQ-binding-like beta-propeller repeat protein [Planctomyces sp.]|nr:PQQ-binding-like beta-propeller repeat protein [Planctomyces sp.]